MNVAIGFIAIVKDSGIVLLNLSEIKVNNVKMFQPELVEGIVYDGMFLKI